MKFSSRKDLFLGLALVLGIRDCPGGSIEPIMLGLQLLSDDSETGELSKFELWVLDAFDKQLDASRSSGYEAGTQKIISQVLEYHGFKRPDDGKSYKDSVEEFLMNYQGDQEPMGANS